MPWCKFHGSNKNYRVGSLSLCLFYSLRVWVDDIAFGYFVMAKVRADVWFERRDEDQGQFCKKMFC